MESQNNHRNDQDPAIDSGSQSIVAGRIEDLPAGSCASVTLADGNEIAVYNVDGEFFATDNSCPHHGAPLADGLLRGHVIECGWHGWQFDVRDGRCLFVSESIATYPVVIEDGEIKIVIKSPLAEE
jgi:nitrite reductase/ring-hydroxylating ferredoxin subunit